MKCKVQQRCNSCQLNINMEIILIYYPHWPHWSLFARLKCMKYMPVLSSKLTLISFIVCVYSVWKATSTEFVRNGSLFQTHCMSVCVRSVGSTRHCYQSLIPIDGKVLLQTHSLYHSDSDFKWLILSQTIFTPIETNDFRSIFFFIFLCWWFNFNEGLDEASTSMRL